MYDHTRCSAVRRVNGIRNTVSKCFKLDECHREYACPVVYFKQRQLKWWAIIQESCLIARKALLIDVLSFLDLYYIDLSWFENNFRWAIIQESCLNARKTLLIDVLSFLGLYYIDLSWFENYFRWAIIQESCLFIRKTLLIDILAFLDLHYIDLSWFDFFFRWAIIQEMLPNR